MCQTLTFTNAKGKQWVEGDVQNPVSALTYFDHVEVSANISNSYNQDLINQVKELYLNPKVLYEAVPMQPAKDIPSKNGFVLLRAREKNVFFRIKIKLIRIAVH